MKKNSGWKNHRQEHALASHGVSTTSEGLIARASKKKRMSSLLDFIQLRSEKVNVIRNQLKDEFGKNFENIKELPSEQQGARKKHRVFIILKQTVPGNKPDSTLFAIRDSPQRFNAFRAEKQGTAKRVESLFKIGDNQKKAGAFVKYNTSFQDKGTILSEYEMVFFEEITPAEKLQIQQLFGVTIR